jgi:DNA-binding transcriptional LysR family regulator
VFDARRLPTFREVARRGSFAAAAEALCFTPSAVSQQIAALEREIGAKLFERGARGVRLTDPGERLLAHADAVLDRLAQAEADLESGVEQRGHRLRLGSLGGARVIFAGWP